jgi:hypothetical protein
MKKYTVAVFAGALLTLFLVGLYLDSQLLPLTKESTYEKEVRNLFEKIQVEVSLLRGLPQPTGVNIRIVSIEFFKSSATQTSDATLLKVQETLYKGLLVIPKNFSLLDKKVSQAGMILAATSGKTMYIVREYFDPADRTQALRVLAHEYTHIMQFENLVQRDIHTEDELRARTAFIEGEADLVADLYMADVMNEEFIFHVPSPSETRPEGVDGGWALDRVFEFPYVYGERFVYQIYLKEGWDGVNRVHKHPPSSSAQILYPDRYFAGLEPMSSVNPGPVRSGWSIYFTDRMGMYFMRTLLLQELPLSAVDDASFGWLGDNVTLYLNHNTYLLFWRSVWIDELSASAFEEALHASFEKMGGVKTRETLWNFGGILITVERTGHVVLLIGSSDMQVLTEEIETNFQS